MNGVDQFFTPEALAIKLVDSASLKSVRSVADFAVGEGQLLDAANARWPGCSLFGIDLDPKMILHLRRRLNGRWIAGDFFSDTFIKKTLRDRNLLFDLVVLNPPFSTRKGGRRLVDFFGCEFRCSAALAFLIRSIEFLSPNGELIAIVPHGLLHGEKDRIAYNALSSRFRVSVVDADIRRQFRGCDIRCSIIKIENRVAENLSEGHFAVLSKHSIFRGTVDHTLFRSKRSRASDVRTVIHTTNLQGGRVSGSFAVLSSSKCGAREIAPALVLIPRVGRPRKDKIVAIDQPHLFAFTSCVICIAFDSYIDACRIRDRIIENWDSFEECYGGTGAQYTTVLKISAFLGSFPSDGCSGNVDATPRGGSRKIH